MTRVLPLQLAKFFSLCLVVFLIFGTGPVVQARTLREVGMATSSSLLSMDDEQLDFRLRDMQKNLGVKWIRVNFDWSVVQPRHYHGYNWRAYDRLVDAAQKHDLKVLAILASTPVWARNTRCAALVKGEEAARKCSPRDTVEFGRFARAATLRYKDKGLHAWEIWNEPNLTGHWKTATANNTITVDPKAYARMATAAAREIRRHDPQSFIITGGLAPMFESKEGKGMRQSDYLEQLLPNLQPHLFDAVGVHPYTWPEMPNLAADYNAFYTVDKGRQNLNLRAIMARAGWGSKQIWATEFGASTKGVRKEGTPLSQGRPDHVSERKQAQIIQMGVRGWYQKPNVGPIFVHADSDQWLMTRKNEGGFGLRRSDGTKKPAYDAMQKSAQQLQP